MKLQKTVNLSRAIKHAESSRFHSKRMARKLREARTKLDALKAKYTSIDSLLELIEPDQMAAPGSIYGHTKLVRGAWLANDCTRFRRCQDLPDKAFWQPRELKAKFE